MLYLLYGDTAPLQIKYEEIIGEIKNKYPGIKEKIFDGSTDDITSFFDSVSTNSMFSPHELIILKRAEDCKNLADIGKSLKMYNLAQKEVVIVYEEFLNDYGKRTNEIGKRVLNAFTDIAEVICFRKENEQKASLFYIQQTLNISQTEAETLQNLIGDDFFKLKNEIDKIKNFLDGDSFSLEKIKNIISINHEANLKNLIETFLLTHDYKNLLRYLKEENLYPLFMYLIADEIIMYLKLTLLIKTDRCSRNISYNNFKDNIYDGIKDYFANDRGAMHPYPVFLKLKNVNLFDDKHLKSKLRKLVEIEYDVKSGNKLIDIEVENYIISFF